MFQFGMEVIAWVVLFWTFIAVFKVWYEFDEWKILTRYLLTEVEEIKAWIEARNQAERVEIYFLNNGKWENSKMAKLVLKASESKKAKMIAKDSFGNEAKFEGLPKWSSMDDSKLELVPSEDGKEVEVKSKGPMGEVKLQCLIDADLGEGVKEVIGEGDVEVVAGDAVSVEISFE